MAKASEDEHTEIDAALERRNWLVNDVAAQPGTREINPETVTDVVFYELEDRELKAPVAGPRRLLGQLTSEERKTYPMATGLLDYFPDALAMVAHISWKGNEKHNPGQPLHWARGKSMDHPDCMVRHLVERYELDDVDAEHSASLVWRSLADLQQHLEKKYDLDPPRAAKDD